MGNFCSKVHRCFIGVHRDRQIPFRPNNFNGCTCWNSSGLKGVLGEWFKACLVPLGQSRLRRSWMYLQKNVLILILPFQHSYEDKLCIKERDEFGISLASNRPQQSKVRVCNLYSNIFIYQIFFIAMAFILRGFKHSNDSWPFKRGPARNSVQCDEDIFSMQMMYMYTTPRIVHFYRDRSILHFWKLTRIPEKNAPKENKTLVILDTCVSIQFCQENIL